MKVDYDSSMSPGPFACTILKRIGIDSSGWCDLVKKFGRLFKRAAGSPESLASEAARRGQSFMQAPGCSLLTID